MSVNKLVGEALELVSPEARRRNMRVAWKPGTQARVVVDPVQVQQVLVNLLHNAFDAAADQPPERRLVSIGLERSDETVTISVTDQGRGIAAEDRARVFDAFFTTKPNGVGIGLAISRSIVEDHGGRLGLSANGESPGVTFHFSLPVAGDKDGCVAESRRRR